MPHIARVADKLTFLKAVNTEEINHDPAVTMAQTGFRLGGRPSMGAWISYGLGCETRGPAGLRCDDLFLRRTASLSMTASGARLSFPAAIKASSSAPSATRSYIFPIPKASTQRTAPLSRRRSTSSNKLEHEEFGDPETKARIAQYEMAYRMQSSVPELTDLSKEPEHTFEMYGAGCKKARHLRLQLSARSPPGRARRPLHPALPSRLGSPRRSARSAAQALQRCRSAIRRSDRRSQAARHAR